MNFQIIILIFIFLIFYFSIYTNYINKTVTVILCSSLLVITGIINKNNLFGLIDWNFIILLYSLTIIANILDKKNLFNYISFNLLKLLKNNIIYIIIFFTLLNSFLSFFISNLITVSLMIPIIISLANNLEKSKKQFIISQIMAINIGGAFSLTGNPQNIIISNISKFSFLDFIIKLFPLFFINILILIIINIFYFKNEKISILREEDFITRKFNFNLNNILSLIIFLLVIIGFIFNSKLNLEIPLICLLGAISLLLLLKKENPDDYFKQIDFSNILFFIGLFIIFGSLNQIGLIRRFSIFIMDLGRVENKIISYIIFWISSFFSGFIDDVPLVSIFIPMVKNIILELPKQNIDSFWWALSLGSSLGGSFTIIGSYSTIKALAFCEKNNYKIKFFEYFKFSFFIIIINLVISFIYFVYFI